MNIQSWFPLGLIGLIWLQFERLSRVFTSTTVWKHQFFSAQPSLWSNSHICTWLPEKAIALAIWTFVDKVISLLFNTLSRFIIAFHPRSKCHLISWLQSLSAVIWGPRNIKSAIFLHFPHLLTAMKWWDQVPCSSFLNVEFQAIFFTLFYPNQEHL